MFAICRIRYLASSLCANFATFCLRVDGPIELIRFRAGALLVCFGSEEGSFPQIFIDDGPAHVV